MHQLRLAFLSVLVFFFGSGFVSKQKVILKVEVTNMQNAPSSKIWVSVFSENDFLEKSIQTKSIPLLGDKVAVEFELPPGEYAVSTYQDVNSNGKLDRYFIGKPKEPYGFSNNVKPFGRPKYKSCAFILTNSPKLISISLNK